MDMRKLLEAVTKFAGEPEQKAGDQVQGTDAATGRADHEFKDRLVGDGKDNMLRGLSQVADDKSLEWELAEAWVKFMEDDLGVEPKRPARKGDRPGREYTKHGKPSKRYTSVKEGWGTGSDRVSLPDRPNTYYSGTGQLQKEYDALYAELVPSQGKADTIEGEVLRASSKIIYRHYNDGDEFNQASFDQLKPYIGHVTSYDDLAHKAIMFAVAAEGEYHPNPNWDSLDVMEYGPEEEDNDDDDDEYYYQGDEEELDEGAADIYSITSERNGRERSKSGTLAELIEYYSYTLETGKSYEHERGRKKINLNPKNIESLVQNLNNAKSNAAANGQSSERFYVDHGNMAEGWAQDSADAQRSLSAAATDRVLQKYQDNPELSAIAKFMSRNNWTAQSIDDTMQGRGKFDIDWWKNTMSKNLPKTKHKRKESAVYEGIESTDPVEGAVLAAVQELIQQGHTEVAPEVITNMVVAATSQPFLLKDLVDVNNKSAAVQHYVNSINPTKVKFSNEILTVKNEDPAKDKAKAQSGVSNMAARAAGRNRLGEASTPLRDREDYMAKNKALQDIQMDPSTSQDPQLTAELARRKAELVQQAKQLGISESRAHKIIANKLKQIELQRKIAGDQETDVNLEQRAERAKAEYRKYVAKMKEINPDYIPLYKMDETGSAIGGSTVGNGASSAGTAALNPETVKQTTAALNTFKAATGSDAPAPNIAKALDAVTQGTAVGGSEMKILEPVMKDLATVATDPKLANQFKSLAGQANQAQQQAK